MEDLSILEGSIGIWKLLESVVSLWLLSSGHESNLVHLEHWLEEIRTTMVHNTLELLIAWVVPETIVVQVALVNTDMAIARHVSWWAAQGWLHGDTVCKPTTHTHVHVSH